MTSKMTSEKCNEPRSEELCGSGRKFQLSWKAKYNWIDGQTSCLCSACTNAVKLQMPLPTTSREKDSYAAFVRRLKSYLHSTMTQEWLNHISMTSCHSEIVKNLDSNQLLDEFIKKAPTCSCTHECFLFP